MKSQAYLERRYGVDEAVFKLISIIDKNFTKYSLSEVGLTSKTYFCEIEDEFGVTSSGIGKGNGEQSKASALAEALEHYYYENDNSTRIQREISIDKFKWFESGSPDFSKIINNKKITFDCYTYNNIFDLNEVIEYPCFLSTPNNYDPSSSSEKRSIESLSLIRYSCNSGTASGLTQDDADLHAILELVERDAISIMLLESVISNNPKPVMKIDFSSAPQDLKFLISSIERELDGVIEIFDMTSDISVPSILVSLTLKIDGARFFGSGSSIFFEYAIERAIQEALQCANSQERLGFYRPIPKAGIDAIGLPKYTRCFMNKGYFLYRGGESLVHFIDLKEKYIIDKNKYLTSGLQIKYLSKRLLDTINASIYRRNISQIDEDLYVTQVVIPELERFYLVTAGLYVSPSRRGYSFLDME